MTEIARRTFLRRLITGSVGLAATFDPERLLWVPGAKTIVLPPAQGWTVGHTFVTADWVSREALHVLKRNLTFWQQIDREYDTRFARFNVPIRVTR